MENASGRAASVGASLAASVGALFRRPSSILFSRPTSLILLLYAGTYLTANVVDTFSSTVLRPASSTASSVSAGPAKFAASSAANVALCIYKDRAFVRMFAAAATPPRPLPLPCYALFALRDSITIFASFNLPPLLGPALDARLAAARLDGFFTGQTAAQFLAPAAVQLLSTPIHLLGLDLYNRPRAPAGPSWRDRAARVRANWLVSAAARVCRIVPAFGVGGVVNTKMRRALMQRLE